MQRMKRVEEGEQNQTGGGACERDDGGKSETKLARSYQGDICGFECSGIETLCARIGYEMLGIFWSKSPAARLLAQAAYFFLLILIILLVFIHPLSD